MSSRFAQPAALDNRIDLGTQDAAAAASTRGTGAGAGLLGPAAGMNKLHGLQQEAADLGDAPATGSEHQARADSAPAASSNPDAAATLQHQRDAACLDPSWSASLRSGVDQESGNPAASVAHEAVLRPITAADFEVAMQHIRPSITRDFTVELTPGTLPALISLRPSCMSCMMSGQAS